MNKTEAIRALDHRVSRLEAMMGSQVNVELVNPYTGEKQVIANAEAWKKVGQSMEPFTQPLIAQEVEVAPEPPALQVGDAVRLERSQGGEAVPVPEVVSSNVAECIRAKDAEIARLQGESESYLSLIGTYVAERDAARAEVDQLREELSRVINISADRVAERDALQARFDAGVPVYSATGELWSTNHKWSQFTKILIDASPIADEMVSATTPSFDGTPTDSTHGTTLDPIAEADERKGERRQTQFIGHVSETTGERIYPRDGEGYQPASRTFPVNRRRTDGTMWNREKK